MVNTTNVIEYSGSGGESILRVVPVPVVYRLISTFKSDGRDLGTDKN